MKIVKYIGGLGNQMFIYAFSVALRETFKQEIFVDTHYYQSRSFHNGLEIERIFGVKLKEARLWDKLRLSWYFPNYWIDFHLLKYLPKRKGTVKELYGGKVNLCLLSDASDKLYDGFWQSYEYFDRYKKVIQDELTFPEIRPNDAKNFRLSKDLKEDTVSVGIHIRRGDYLKNWKYRGLCGVEYYRNAIAYIKGKVENPRFYLFSDDIPWVEEHIYPSLEGFEVTVINWNHKENSFKDMQLMSMCKNLIIANSSFSWWAAYLAKEIQIVVAPEKWINSPQKFVIQCADWVKF